VAGNGSGLAGSRAVSAASERLVSLVTALRAVVSPTTWLAVVHLLAGPFIGVASFVMTAAGLVLGVVLLPVLGVGIPVLALALWLCRLFARAERARFALLLGRDFPTPAAPAEGKPRHRMWRFLRSATAWRNVIYALVRFPLGLAEAAAITIVWSLGLALLTVPAYNMALPGGGAHLGGFMLGGAWPLTLAALAGLVLLMMAPPLIRALAAADASVAGWLIGSGNRAELTARIGELETSRARVVDAAEAERMRIERDLHDGAQQRLVSLAMELGRAKTKFPTDPEAAAAIVGQAHEQAKEALTELRNLVRGVHPPVLTDRGLDAALSGLAALSPVPVTVRVDLPVRPPASVEAIAYFVVAEALTNVAKHARASHADVTVSRSGDLLTMAISDNGIGGADLSGQGLSGLAARVAGVDGRLVLTSPAGGPTLIEAVLPCGS